MAGNMLLERESSCSLETIYITGLQDLKSPVICAVI